MSDILSRHRCGTALFNVVSETSNEQDTLQKRLGIAPFQQKGVLTGKTAEYRKFLLHIYIIWINEYRKPLRVVDTFCQHPYIHRQRP